MCDETKLEEWARGAISRRQFGALSGAAALAACAQGASEGKASTTAGLKEQGVSFATPDGTMDGFLVQPEAGKHPAVILWPDIASIREAKRNIARALAGSGYAVLVVNPCVDGPPLARVFLHCAGWSWRPCVRPVCAALHGRWP